MFSFRSLASMKLMYAILFLGTKVDIRTFTKLIFLSSYMTRQVTFNNNSQIWKWLVSHKNVHQQLYISQNNVYYSHHFLWH